MPLGITATPRLVEPVDVGYVASHVVRAGDHAVGAVCHPLLDPVDPALRVVLHPALMAAVLGGVDRSSRRGSPKRRAEVVAGDGDEPVVSVHEIEREVVAEIDAGGEHVGVHVLDPGDELRQVAWAPRLAGRGAR